MAFNGSGIFSKLYSWVVEQASPPIEISKLDAQETDFATGLSNCILRDGTGVPTAATPWNSQNLTGVGNLTSSTATFSGAVGMGALTVTTVTASGAISGTTITGSGAIAGTTLTGSSTASATAFIPTGASVPTNGLYLSAANTPALASNTTLRWSVNSTGNHVFAAPSSGVTATINSTSDNQLAINATGQFSSVYWQHGGTARAQAYLDDTNNRFVIGGANAATALRLTYGISSVAMDINSSGNVTVNAPSSGTSSLLVNAGTGIRALTLSNTTSGSGSETHANLTNGADSDLQFVVSQVGAGTKFASIGPSTATSLLLQSGGSTRVSVLTGVQIGTPTGGDKGAGTLNTAGNIYVNNVQVPRSAFANVAGTGGAVSQAQGVSFTSHTNGTGIYVLALTGFSGTPVAVAGPRNASGIAAITSISSSSVTIQTYSDAGVPTDVDFALIVQGVS